MILLSEIYKKVKPVAISAYNGAKYDITHPGEVIGATTRSLGANLFGAERAGDAPKGYVSSPQNASALQAQTRNNFISQGKQNPAITTGNLAGGIITGLNPELAALQGANKLMSAKSNQERAGVGIETGLNMFLASKVPGVTNSLANQSAKQSFKQVMNPANIGKSAGIGYGYGASGVLQQGNGNVKDINAEGMKGALAAGLLHAGGGTAGVAAKVAMPTVNKAVKSYFKGVHTLNTMPERKLMGDLFNTEPPTMTTSYLPDGTAVNKPFEGHTVRVPVKDVPKYLNEGIKPGDAIQYRYGSKDQGMVDMTFTKEGKPVAMRTDDPSIEAKLTGIKPASQNKPLGTSELQGAMANPETQYRVRKPQGSLDLAQVEASISTTPTKVRKPISQTTHDFATQFLNRFQPILDYTKGKNLTPEKNPYYMVKQYLGGNGIANAKIEYELKPIIQSVGSEENLNTLRNLMVAQTQTERAARGVGTDATVAIEQIRSKVGEAQFAKLNEAAAQLRAYESKLLDEWASVGGISPEGLAKIKANNQMHAPLQRVMDDLEKSGFIQAGNKSLNSTKQVIQAAKGSERAIIDPLESIVGNTYQMQQAIQKQKVMNALIDLGTKEGDFNPLRTAENVQARISLYSQAKEIKPVQALYERLVKTRTGWQRTLESEINKLNKKGLHLSLKEKSPLPVEGKVVNPVITKKGLVRTPEAKLSNRNFRQLMDNLVNLPSSEIQQIKKMISTRENKLGPIMDQISEMSDLADNIKQQRSALIDEARMHRDAETKGLTVLSRFKDGIKEYYEVPKPIADSIKGMDEEQLNTAIKMMSVPATWLRAGATGLNAGFAVPNVIRDQLTAAVNNKYGGIPIYDFISGMASYLKKDDAFKQWLLSGADQASFVSQDRGALQKTVGDLVEKPWVARAKTLTHPVDLLRAISDFSEKGTRVGTFKRALKGASKEYGTGTNATLEAMLQSREATIDFAQRGSKMKAYNAITPFLNARLQGVNKLLSSFRQRPLQTAGVGMAIAGIPAAALYIYNSEDPAYNEIPDYIKQNNFIIMTGNKDVPFYKIPKGEIGQIFGNPVENFLSYMKGNDAQGYADLSKNLLASISPVSNVGDVIPTAFKLPIELTANYDTFRGQNIVSPYKTDLPAPLQANANTSETAKYLGNAFNQSPAKIDYTISGVTGGLGKQATTMLDAGVFGKNVPLNQAPIVDRFMGKPADLSKTAQTIYENEAKRKQQTALTNYKAKELIKQGLQSGNQDLLRQAAEMSPDNYNQFVGDMLKEIKKPNMTPTEKAIQSLPKTQQAIINKQLSDNGAITPITGTPTAKIAVGSTPTAKAAGRSNGTGLMPGITQAGNSYIATVNGSPKVFGDLDEANRAVAKAQLKGGKKTVAAPDGNTIYRLDKGGNVETLKLDQLKAEAEAQALTNQIELAKRSKDYASYYKLNEQLYNNLQSKIDSADPTFDATDILKWQNQQADIASTISKYQSYGGSFSKPKKAKSVKISAPKLKLPKITQPKASKAKAPKLAKVKVAKVKKPKVIKR